jgi:hypothetical protein
VSEALFGKVNDTGLAARMRPPGLPETFIDIGLTAPALEARIMLAPGALVDMALMAVGILIEPDANSPNGEAAPDWTVETIGLLPSEMFPDSATTGTISRESPEVYIVMTGEPLVVIVLNPPGCKPLTAGVAPSVKVIVWLPVMLFPDDDTGVSKNTPEVIPPA